MAGSRLWGTALVLTPRLHSTHLVRLTSQTLGGPHGSTAVPSMEVQEGSTGHHQPLQPSYSHGQASCRGRGGRRKPVTSPAQCSPSWSSDQGRKARGRGLVGPAPRRPKAAGVLVGHGGSAWVLCSFPHLGSCEKALILTGTSAHQWWPLKLVKHELAVPSCCSHSYSDWLIKKKGVLTSVILARRHHLF